MRPDEHKKKRSAQYNKKKATKEGKKDNQSASGSGKGDQRNRAPVPSKAQQQQQQNTASVTSRSSDSSENEEPTVTKQRPNFKRREIVSNWSRYEITEGDSEAQPQPLPDYSKLLSAAGGASSHFRFKDEAEWEEELSPLTDDPQTTSVLDLDLSDLGQAIQCIPLYDRLSIPPKLFTDEQKNEMMQEAEVCRVEYVKSSCHGDSVSRDSGQSVSPSEKSDSQSVTQRKESDSQSGRPRGKSDGQSGRLREESDGQSVNKINSSPKVHSANMINAKPSSAEVCQNSPPKQSCSEQIPQKGQTSYASEQHSNEADKESTSKIKRVLTSASQEEELDFLLSMGETNNSSTITTTTFESANLQPKLLCEHNNSSKVGADSNKIEPDHGAVSPGGLSAPLNNTGKKLESENLEDWLDSILDD